MVIPESFSGKVKSWLGNKEELFKEAKKQVSISHYRHMILQFFARRKIPVFLSFHSCPVDHVDCLVQLGMKVF